MIFSEGTIERVAKHVLGTMYPGNTHSTKVVDKALKHTRAALDELRPEDIPIEPGDGFQKVITVPMLLWCPECGDRHVDRGAFATRIHHTHACQSCGHVWRPAKVATVGVQFLPGYKDPK